MISAELANRISKFCGLWEKWLNSTLGIGLKDLDESLRNFGSGDLPSLQTALSAKGLPRIPLPVYVSRFPEMDRKACLDIRKQWEQDKQAQTTTTNPQPA